MKNVLTFSPKIKKILGFGIYYVLYAAFVLIGTMRDWPVLLLSIFLLLVMLVAVVGGGGNHVADYNAFEQQPLVAQDLPPVPRESQGLKFPISLLLVLPPVLYLVFVFF